MLREAADAAGLRAKKFYTAGMEDEGDGTAAVELDIRRKTNIVCPGGKVE